MPIKKSELYSSIWASCDELRGGMDASQYKDYVLVLLFMKYISDKYAAKKYAPIIIPEGGGFGDMVALKGDKEIGDQFNKIIGRLAEANNLKGVIDVADFNDPEKLGRGKEMVDKLSNLIAIFENPALDFSGNRAEDDDLLGDAYEYLMRHFATQSGKSKGQFYTPAEVSRVIAQVIGIQNTKSQDQTLYDPTCGSGSLLLKAAALAPDGISIYGQEMDNATAALAKMNMILHDNPTAEIWQDNSLARPHWVDGGRLKMHDFVVANPPFSNKAWRTGFDPENDLYHRFEYGVPPKKNGDYAFLLHILASLKSTGRAAVVMPHGVLFRGNVEGDIRRELVRRGYIEGIIGLPPNLFYGTGIPACIVVLDKSGAVGRQGIFMIDASAGFEKDGPKNRLRHQDIRKIVDVYNNQLQLVHFSRLVPIQEIEVNEYNLNLPRYIDTTEPEDLHDIAAHLRGGIPQPDIDDLARYWEVFPGLKESLFKFNEHEGYLGLRIPADEVRETITKHPDFVAFSESVMEVFQRWCDQHRPRLMNIGAADSPKALIDELSESILSIFAGVRLIDKYDIFQHLMRFWSNVMQDDVYMIIAEGWDGANKLRLLDAKSKEDADLKIGKLKYKTDLIPPSLIIDRYFTDDRAEIEQMEAEIDELASKQQELEEEYGGDEGLLEEAKSDAGNVTKGALRARIQEIKGDPEFEDEFTVLSDFLTLMEQEAATKSKYKAAIGELEDRIKDKYSELQQNDIQRLIVEAKWLDSISSDLHSELLSISGTLQQRVLELTERYKDPLPQIESNVVESKKRVREHLARMGFTWN